MFEVVKMNFEKLLIPSEALGSSFNPTVFLTESLTLAKAGSRHDEGREKSNGEDS